MQFFYGDKHLYYTSACLHAMHHFLATTKLPKSLILSDHPVLLNTIVNDTDTNLQKLANIYRAFPMANLIVHL